MIKIRSQKFVVIIVCLMTWSLSFLGCNIKSATEFNRICGDGLKCSITSITPVNPKVGETITINFHVELCNDYKNGYIKLSYILPNEVDLHLIKKWTIDPYGSLAYDVSYPFTPQSRGQYTIRVAMFPPLPAGSDESHEHTPDLDFKYIQVGSAVNVSYPIIQLETQYTTQVGTETVTKVNSLWPNDEEHSFIGTLKRDIAFFATGTSFEIKQYRQGLIQLEDFIDANELRKWIYSQAAKKTDWSDLDRNVTIIAGISDVNNTILQSNAQGFCEQRSMGANSKSPAIAVIAEQRYRDISYLDEFQKKMFMVGGAIHELGHSTGIIGDDPTIIPGHAGENSSDCLMLSPSTTNTYTTNPHFCAGHIDFIKHTSWIINP